MLVALFVLWFTVFVRLLCYWRLSWITVPACKAVGVPGETVTSVTVLLSGAWAGPGGFHGYGRPGGSRFDQLFYVG